MLCKYFPWNIPVAGKTFPYKILVKEILATHAWNPLFVNRSYAILQPKNFIIFNLRLLVNNFELKKNCEIFSEFLVLQLYYLEGTVALKKCFLIIS